MSADGDEREEPSFKVIDRRRFDSDGSEREAEEADSAPTASQSSAPGTAPDPSSGPAAATASQSDAGPAVDGPEDADPSRLGVPQGEAYLPPDPPSDPAPFATLVLSLSTQVLILLGEIPEAPGAAPQQDLVAAKNVIDILGELQKKTQGNLSDDESQLLEQALYDLRMRFVQLKEASGRG